METFSSEKVQKMLEYMYNFENNTTIRLLLEK